MAKYVYKIYVVRYNSKTFKKEIDRNLIGSYANVRCAVEGFGGLLRGANLYDSYVRKQIKSIKRDIRKGKGYIHYTQLIDNLHCNLGPGGYLITSEDS